MRIVHWAAPAEAEFLEAVEWHAEHRPGLEEAFAAEVNHTVARAAENAELGTPYVYRTHQLLLSRFRYSVVYMIRPDEVWIVAVAHQRRRPGYWRRRMKDIP